MEIILGKTAGFCYGVKNAINVAMEEANNDVYCLGEIVHNENVLKDLQKKGIKFIYSIEDAKETTIIRAHGATKQEYRELQRRGIDIKDLTCPKVLKTHKIAEEYIKKNYFIILIGIKCHPEAIATLSFCGENSYLLQEKEDIEESIEKIKKSNLNNILIIAQTTYNSKKFDDIIKELNNKLKDKNIEIKKTICPSTEIRQTETREMSKKVDCMIIIGDKKSSNTNKLYDISKENCQRVYFVQNLKELNIEDIKDCKKVGVMAGASTPNKDIEEVVKKLRSMV